MYTNSPEADYERWADAQERAEGMREEVAERAYKYYLRKLKSTDADNIEESRISLGGKHRYSFGELMFDYVGQHAEVNEKFCAMLKTEAGQEFLEEIARQLADKFPEMGLPDED